MLRRVFIFSGIACLLVSSVAFGANTGRLIGEVLDNDGVPLPGVTVQITSIVLIGGPQVAVTDAKGAFAFNLLQVGEYTVEANLAGFRPAAGSVGVSADAEASVTFRMIPEQFGGEIEVSAEVPVVDTSQVNARQVWGEDYLRNATVGTANRGYQSILSQAAGVTGGSNPNVFGSTVGENAYLIDGMNTTDPVTGTWSTMFNIDAVQEMNFQTGGFEAEFGQATGGIVNLVTKSGGNQFSGSFDARFRNEGMTERGDYYNPDEISESRKQYSGTLGGPFMRDKLWFFSSAQFIDSETQEVGSFFVRDWEGWQFLGKMTWQAAEGHRVIGKFTTDPAEIPGVNSGQFVLESGKSQQDQGGDIWQLELNSVLTESWLLNAQVGISTNYIDVFSAVNPDTISGHFNEDTEVSYHSYWRGYYDQRDRDEYRVNASWFVDEFAGSHEFKAGVEYNEVVHDNVDYYNGGARIYDVNVAPVGGFEPVDLNGDGYFNRFIRREEPLENVKDPVIISGETSTFFLQDSWRPHPNLTIKPGVRFDNVKQINTVEKIADMDMWQPRLGFAWDVMGDSKHVIRGSVGRFMDPTALNIASFASGVIEYTAEYTTLEYYCNLSRGLWCSPEDLPASFPEPFSWTNWDGIEYTLIDNLDTAVAEPAQTLDQAGLGKLNAPHTDHYIFAYETQLWPQTSIEVSYIYKETDDIIEDTCIGNTWAYDSSAPFPDIDDPSTWTTGADCPGWLIVNMNVYDRKYDAAIVNLETRRSWGHITASYTHSDSRGTNISGPRHYAYGAGDYFPVNFYNYFGKLNDHRDQRLKVNGYVLLPKRFTIGIDGFWSSAGHASVTSTCSAFLGANRRSQLDQMDALGIDPATLDYCSTSGVSGTYDIYHWPRGSLKTKSIWQLDLQLTKAFTISNLDVEAILTVQNIFGNEFDRTFNSTAFRQQTDDDGDGLFYQDDDPSAPYYDEYYGADGSPVLTEIGAPLTYWDPRRYEVGIRIEF